MVQGRCKRCGHLMWMLKHSSLGMEREPEWGRYRHICCMCMTEAEKSEIDAALLRRLSLN